MQIPGGEGRRGGGRGGEGRVGERRTRGNLPQSLGEGRRNAGYGLVP